MTTTASPAAQFTCRDGTKIPLRELTLHPSDDTARQSLRVAEEFTDAAIGFQNASLKSPDAASRKKAIEYAAEMRHQRDLALREFLYTLVDPASRKLIEEKLLPECGDTEVELILRIVREGSADANRNLYEKLKKVFAPIEFGEQVDLWMSGTEDASLKLVYEKLLTRFGMLPSKST